MVRGKQQFIMGLRRKKSFKENSLSKQVGTLLSYGNIGGPDTIGTPDDALIEMGNLELLEGRFPEKSGEIAMEASLLSALELRLGGLIKKS